MIQYGVYDKQERIWYGNERGPLLFEDWDRARVAARIIDKQLNHPPGRSKALPLLPEASLHLRDDVAVSMSPLEALTELEEGR